MTTTSNIKILVRGAYDLQKLRVSTGNRIAMNFRSKLGQGPGEKTEDALDAEALKVLANVKESYRRLTDGLTKPIPAKFKGDGVIDTYTEAVLVSQYLGLEANEKAQFKHLGKALEEYPIYTEFLKGVKGVGPAMAGVLISELDPHKAKYPSSFWKYAGLDVTKEGTGRSRKADSLEDREYVDKDGEVKTKKSLTYNPFLKTKLMGVLATAFLRAGENKYSTIYNDYKNRLQNRPDWKEKTKLHIHNASMRYMVKMFLVDLYTEWRTLEGLPVAAPYSEAKLGIKHDAA